MNRPVSTSSSQSSKAASAIATHGLSLVSRQHASHIVVDLASSKVEAALDALQRIPGLSKGVRSATVHAQSLLTPGYSLLGQRVHFDTAHILYVFDALSSLPNLKTLTVELNYYVPSFPIAALAAVLRQKRLRRLSLKHLQFVAVSTTSSSVEEVEQLQALIAQQDQLAALCLDNCRGLAAVQTLVRHLPLIKELRITNTALAPKGNLQIDTVTSLVTGHSRLQSLKLNDIPELEDAHCVALVQAIENKNSSNNSTANKLKEFHVASSLLSDPSAVAIAKMLSRDESLRKVSILLDSESLGTLVAQALRHNQNAPLEWLDMRLNTNDYEEVERQLIPIAQALESSEMNGTCSSSALKSLRIRLDIELDNITPPIVNAFAKTLETNTVLESISLDDGAFRFPLTSAMKFKMQLNHCGIRNLLSMSSFSQEAPACQDMVNVLVKTVTSDHNENQHQVRPQTSSKRNPYTSLDATFYLLSNFPEMIQWAATTTTTTTTEAQSLSSPPNCHHNDNNQVNSASTSPSSSSRNHCYSYSSNFLSKKQHKDQLGWKIHRSLRLSSVKKRSGGVMKHFLTPAA